MPNLNKDFALMTCKLSHQNNNRTNFFDNSHPLLNFTDYFSYCRNRGNLFYCNVYKIYHIASTSEKLLQINSLFYKCRDVLLQKLFIHLS